MVRLIRGLVLATGVYAVVCVLLTSFQSKLIYFPARDYDATPADVGLEFEDLSLRTEDGVNLAVWFVPHPKARGTLIFFQGNAGNMSHRLDSVRDLRRMRLNVLIFDYRGYGHSEGKPTEEGTYKDADAVWRYVVSSRGESANRVVLFGRSLGGAIAIDLAKRHRPAALVVESTFTSLTDIGRLHYPFLPVRLILKYRYASLEKVPAIDCPKLFLHGPDDKLIPLSNGRRLFAAAAEPKAFIETPGGHNDAGFASAPEYAAQLERFIERALDGG